jgi:hypothetical protein
MHVLDTEKACQDGLKGCEMLGVVQDEASSVVWGMPGFVARMGLAGKLRLSIRLGQRLCGRRVCKRQRGFRLYFDYHQLTLEKIFEVAVVVERS